MCRRTVRREKIEAEEGDKEKHTQQKHIYQVTQNKTKITKTHMATHMTLRPSNKLKGRR